ncbi:MAG TPA: hypothetical protein VMT30_07900 [Candidatus Saccharimonadia bacterium]|nr:hypothetical protein [Candidatus Saccharimonadia bacterium]
MNVGLQAAYGVAALAAAMAFVWICVHFGRKQALYGPAVGWLSGFALASAILGIRLLVPAYEHNAEMAGEGTIVGAVICGVVTLAALGYRRHSQTSADRLEMK